MTSLRLTTVPFAGDVAALLASLPAVPGVGQILGPEARNLMVGRGAHLRRWAAAHLGAGKPPRAGTRPPTNLAPIATAIAFVETTSAFHQRLVYERLMARYVPLSKRRDLKPPGWLHLDVAERFPRITVRAPTGERGSLFGPFRDRRVAEAARQRLHKLLPLRPCDYVFEPDPALPLGLGCVYAQVGTCAAPCLSRTTEDAYRALAADAASLLARPEAREAELGAVVPPWVGALEGSAAVVAEVGSAGLELYPVREGAVLEEWSVQAKSREPLEDLVAALRWPHVEEPPDDSPWLSAWLNAPRRAGAFLRVDPSAPLSRLAERLRDKLGPLEDR